MTRQTNLPILVTIGAPDKTDTKDLAEAQVMKIILENEYLISPNWIEDQSNTIQENAQRSAEILKKDAIQSVYFVTHFWRMPRAKTVFEKQDLRVL